MTGRTTVSADVAQTAMQQALQAQTSTTSTAPTGTIPPIIVQAGSGHVLTVGTGMEFATLSAALHASVDGDTILVRAGTYVNDFCTVNTNVTVLALGGMVHEVATVPPPNDKGLIVTNANLTIRGFSFTGGSDGSPDGNVSAIRYQAGNLNVSNCDIYGMQEGILATPNVAGTGTITISNAEVFDCGTGDGLSHDIYVGAVADFTLSDSYIHNANVGHEVKSRALETVIRNNVIADNATGTASYDIDIPNAGNAIIVGNTIEKGPEASNGYAIHYGGETQYTYPVNALLIKDNTIINDDGPSGVAVLNQSALNGLNVTARLVDDSLYGFSPQNIVIGAGHVSGLTTLAAEPTYSTASPWTSLPDYVLGTSPERLNLINFGNDVSGGSNLLIVDDTGGNNTVAGGSGGLQLTGAVGWDVITTLAGATDTMTLNGRNNSVTSAGHDSIIDNGQYDQIDASGNAAITGNSFASYNLSGDEQITVNGGGLLSVLAGGDVTATVGANGVTGQTYAGATLQILGAGTSGVLATIAGGATNFCSTNGEDLRLNGGSAAVTATLGSGAFNITGSSGNDDFTLGTGSATLNLGAGDDTVSFGSGAATVNAGTGADTFIFTAGDTGNVTIAGFQQNLDTLTMQGFSGAAVAGGSMNDGSTLVTLTNGTTIDFLNVALPAYVGGTGGGSGGGGTQTTASGTVTLSSGGHLVTGGGSLLTVDDYVGGNTIAGGSGGLQTGALSGDVIGTAADVANELLIAGRDTLAGTGADQVTVTGVYDSVAESAAATVLLSVFGNTVQGGAGLLTVSDGFGGNTIAGGAGGLAVSVSGAADVISTAQGAQDTIAASGGYSAFTLAGNDAVSLSGNYNVVTAIGNDSIAAANGWSTYTLDGQDTLSGAGAGAVTVGSAAYATLNATGAGGSDVTKLAGGTLALKQLMPDGSLSSVTVSGGTATAGSSGAAYAGISVTTNGGGDSITVGSGSVSVASAGADTIWAGTGSLSVTASGALKLFGGSGQTSVTAGAAGVSVCGGAGNTTLTGGTGNDSFVGGTGSSLLWLGNGADSVTFGAGSSVIHAGGGADRFTITEGTGGSDTIFGFGGNDTISLQGFTGNPVASESVGGGNAYVTLTDGTSVEFAGTTQLPHFG